jgi:hypothetical protein
MATKMTSAQIKETAKSTVLAKFTALYDSLSAEMVGNIAYIPVTVGGQEVWVEVKLTTKQWTDTKVSDAFDPFTAREEYEEEQRIKAEEKAIKEKEKAAKVARSAAKRAKTSKVKATAEQSDED